MNYIIKFPSLKTLNHSRVKRSIPFLTTLAVVCLISVGVLGNFLFGNNLLLFADIGSDTFYSYYAAYYFFVSHITNFQLPLWSFNIGAGSSVLILYQFLYDPFSVIYYLGGVGNISRLIVWVFVLKIFFAATFTYLYLRYLGIGIYARTIASVLFAFNGFLMCFGQHYFYATWVIFLPLLLFTFEIWFKEDKWLPLALCVSFIVLNIAIFWQMTVFIGLYILIRLGTEWDKYTRFEWCFRIVKLGGICLLGIGISAVLWLPEYALLKSSPRISINFFQAFLETLSNFVHFNTPDYYWSLLARIFSNNLQGIGSEYTGFLNYYESIQLYVGILPLLILPQLFSVFSQQAKWLSSILILAVAAFLLFLGFSQLMNGFQYPSYRWGYNIIMFELILASLVLDAMLKKQKINLSLLVATGFLLFLCVVSIILNGHSLDIESFKKIVTKAFQIIAFIVFYSLILYFLITAKNKRWAFSLLLLLICAELIIEHRDSFSKRSVFNKGIEQNRDVNFFDYGNEASQQLKVTDSTFYRIEKNHWILSLNDSLIQKYFGLDSYNSINTPSYIRFLKEFGYSFRNLNVVKWNSLEHPYWADVLSVKYHMTKDSSALVHDATYVTKYGDVSIYKRNSYLPFGFTYESYFLPAVFNQLNFADKERALIQGAVLEEKPPINIIELHRISSLQDNDYFRDGLRKDVLRLVEMDGDKIIGNIHLEHSKLLFLSIPFDPGWSAYVNGKKSVIHTVNVGFSGLYLEQGDSQIELEYTPPYMKQGAAISLFSLILVILIQIRSKFLNKNSK